MSAARLPATGAYRLKTNRFQKDGLGGWAVFFGERKARNFAGGSRLPYKLTSGAIRRYNPEL